MWNAPQELMAHGKLGPKQVGHWEQDLEGCISLPHSLLLFTSWPVDQNHEPKSTFKLFVSGLWPTDENITKTYFGTREARSLL